MQQISHELRLLISLAVVHKRSEDSHESLEFTNRSSTHTAPQQNVGGGGLLSKVTTFLGWPHPFHFHEDDEQGL
jgi:hypothetical protein